MYEKEYANFRIPVSCLAQEEINQWNEKIFADLAIGVVKPTKQIWMELLPCSSSTQDENYKEIIALSDIYTAWIC